MHVITVPGCDTDPNRRQTASRGKGRGGLPGWRGLLESFELSPGDFVPVYLSNVPFCPRFSVEKSRERPSPRRRHALRLGLRQAAHGQRDPRALHELSKAAQKMNGDETTR
jgi:hypothetical protein